MDDDASTEARAAPSPSTTSPARSAWPPRPSPAPSPAPGGSTSVTAERIRRVADELGYRTNPLARALSTSRTHMIALVVSDVANPFYSEIIRGAQADGGEGRVHDAAGRRPGVRPAGTRRARARAARRRRRRPRGFPDVGLDHPHDRQAEARGRAQPRRRRRPVRGPGQRGRHPAGGRAPVRSRARLGDLRRRPGGVLGRRHALAIAAGHRGRPADPGPPDRSVHPGRAGRDACRGGAGGLARHRGDRLQRPAGHRADPRARIARDHGARSTSASSASTTSAPRSSSPRA